MKGDFHHQHDDEIFADAPTMGTEVGTTSFFYPPGMCSDDGLSGDLCLCQSAQKLVFQIWMVMDLGGIEGSWIFASFWKQTGVWDVFFFGGL